MDGGARLISCPSQTRTPICGRSGAAISCGIFNYGGTLTLTNSTLTANTAQGASGASGFGGAVFNLNGTVTVTFSTLADNTVIGGTGSSNAAAGEAIYNLGDNGVATQAGPTLPSTTATVSLVNSILAGSTDRSGNLISDFVTNTNASGTQATSGNNNLIQTDPNNFAGSNTLTGDPLLGSLQNNGGPTPTLALLPGSPAIGAGVPIAGVTTDQRGLPRPGTPSLGAFEPQPASPTPPTPPTPPAAAAIQFTSIQVVPNLFALNQTETLHVYVSGPGGGTVTFTVDGHNVSAPVDGNGDATASLTLPLLTAASPQSIDAVFSGPDYSPATATQTAFWGLLDALLPAVDTLAANGGQAVQSFLMGLPLLDFLYSPSGRLTQVVYGPNLLSWDFLSVNGLTVVMLDGVLPVAVMARTP